MKNPNGDGDGDGDDTGGEIPANADVASASASAASAASASAVNAEGNLSDSIDDDDTDANTDVYTRVVLHMNRNPPPRIAELPEAERIAQLNQMIMPYKKTDAEKERDKIYKYTRLNYHPIAHARDVYRLRADEIFLESFLMALQTNSAEEMVNMIPADASINGVYKFNMMTRRSCRLISHEIQEFNQWCTENGCKTSPPTMYKHASVPNYFGLQTIIDKLVEYLVPVVKAYFGCDGDGVIDSQFSFSVTFGLGDGVHRSIDPNYGDDSDISIKLCLADLDSNGSHLVFGERRCVVHETMQEEPLLKELKVEMGQVVLHSGRHRNGFTPIDEYSKEYLIIWCKSYLLREMDRLKRPKLCVICERLRKERLDSFKSQMDNAIAAVDGRSVSPGGNPGSPSGEARKEQKTDNAIAAVDGRSLSPGGNPASPSGEARKEQKTDNAIAAVDGRSVSPGGNPASPSGEGGRNKKRKNSTTS